MIAVFAPGSVSNVACGFDVLGFALDEPGDVVVARRGRVRRLDRRHPRRRRPVDARSAAEHRVGGRAGAAAAPRNHPRDVADDSQGPAARERHRQQRRQRRGRGRRRQRAARPAGADGRCCSSARWPASRPDAAPFIPTTSRRRCLAASSSRGARSRPTSSACRCPRAWRARFCIRRSRSKPAPHDELIGDQVPLKDATRQWANVGGLVAALYTSISRCSRDRWSITIAEPKRASLVPGFCGMKAAAIAAGALGCSLSGSGPSIFALAASIEIARAAGDAMQTSVRRAQRRRHRFLGLPGGPPGRARVSP